MRLARYIFQMKRLRRIDLRKEQISQIECLGETKRRAATILLNSAFLARALRTRQPQTWVLRQEGVWVVPGTRGV